jgi:hypothetical protein
VAYVCPRCSGPVERGGHVPGFLGGVVGVLLAAAFGGFTCKQCGPIPKAEFPPEVQQKMTTTAVLLALGAIAVLVIAITLVALVTSRGR